MHLHNPLFAWVSMLWGLKHWRFYMRWNHRAPLHLLLSNINAPVHTFVMSCPWLRLMIADHFINHLHLVKLLGMRILCLWLSLWRNHFNLRRPCFRLHLFVDCPLFFCIFSNVKAHVSIFSKVCIHFKNSRLNYKRHFFLIYCRHSWRTLLNEFLRLLIRT